MNVDTWISSEWRLNYGGPKAKRDICAILSRSTNSRFFKVEEACWAECAPSLHASLVQYPLPGLTSPKRAEKRDTFDGFISYWANNWSHRVLLVHDLKALQARAFTSSRTTNLAEIEAREAKLANAATSIVVHSQPMERLFRDLFPDATARLVPLGLFDYLASPPIGISGPRNSRAIRIAYCGNIVGSSLFEELEGGLPCSDHISYTLFLTDASKPVKSVRRDLTIHYSIPADELPARLAGQFDFGLCWWGESVVRSGYLSFIAPHKASCYLAAGLPLLAPKGTYIGDLAEQNGFGRTVDSLAAIGSCLAQMETTSIRHMGEACRDFQERIVNGRNTLTALEAALV